LIATAPTASNHGYAQAQPFRQNTFGALEADDTEEESVNESIATQVAALTYQSQLMANMAGCKHKCAPRTTAGTPCGATTYDAQEYASTHCWSQCSEVQSK
jgi:hypothetical protein